MLDGYEEVWEMAGKLGLPKKPLWFDQFGCPRWKEPKDELRMFIKAIRCQSCGQEFNVCLVDDVYRNYTKGGNFIFHGSVPKHWSYGDPPAHPNSKTNWEPDWWAKGWDLICTGVTMTSISEWEFEEWDFEKSLPLYKEEHLAANEKKAKS